MTLREQVERLVKAYFGDEASGLYILPLLHEPYLTHALGHVYALSQLAGVDPKAPGVEPLSAAYCFLACHYILVDNTLDGQIDVEASLLQISQLISLFLMVAESEVCDRLPQEKRGPVRTRMLGRLAQRDRALRLEMDLRTGWAVSEHDFEAAVGRSSLSLLFYELLCGLKGNDPDPDAIEALSQFLYSMQMADDMIDWRKDLAKDNHTPFLRHCAARIASAEPTEADFEQAILLDGYFEECASELALRFQAIESAFRDLGGGASALYARQSYDKIVTNLSGVVGTKAGYLKTVAR
jgi:hypothetical protein